MRRIPMLDLVRLVTAISKDYNLPAEQVIEIVERARAVIEFSYRPPKPCRHCGVHHQRQGVYCSNACKMAAFRKRQAEKHKPQPDKGD